jgi:hypothetical protein
VTVPCPTGAPILQVVGNRLRVGAKPAVEGLVRNPTAADVVVRSFTLRATVAGRDITAPGTDHELVVPANSTVRWEADLPPAVPIGSLVGVTLGDWAWRDPALSSRCPSP